MNMTATQWLPVSPPLSPGLTLGKVVELRADRIVPGLYLHVEIRGADGELHDGPPARVMEIDAYPGVDNMLRFTLDNGIGLPFEPDDIVTHQWILAPEPAWCRIHSVDSDGTVRHCGAEESLTFADSFGHEFTILASATRYDDPDGTIESGPMVTVSVLGSAGGVSSGLDFEMGPELARELAELMTRVAASITDSPNLVDVASTRLDDEIFTADGWQSVTLIMHDGRLREVAVYTVSEDDAAIRLPLGTLVDVRRGGAR